MTLDRMIYISAGRARTAPHSDPPFEVVVPAPYETPQLGRSIQPGERPRVPSEEVIMRYIVSHCGEPCEPNVP